MTQKANDMTTKEKLQSLLCDLQNAVTVADIEEALEVLKQVEILVDSLD